jgi:hypothetical protein
MGCVCDLPTGWLLFALNIVMAAGASYIIRRKHFNTFYALHIFLSVSLLVVAMYHFMFIVVAGAALWLADIFIRYIYRACESPSTFILITICSISCSSSLPAQLSGWQTSSSNTSIEHVSACQSW